jgi:hypothetical protein
MITDASVARSQMQDHEVAVLHQFCTPGYFDRLSTGLWRGYRVTGTPTLPLQLSASAEKERAGIRLR